MRYLLIDDEELARSRLKSLLDECSLSKQFTFVGEANNALDGIKLFHKVKPDVIFLDIQMPQLSGFDFLDLLPTDYKAKIIFVTAYDEFALKAFEAHAVDYLMKPVKKSRLDDSLARLLQEFGNTESTVANSASSKQKIPVTYKQETLLLPIADILWIESRDTMTFVHTKSKQIYRCDKTLDDLEQRYDGLFRLHRSYLVAVNEINKLIPWFNSGIKVELSSGLQLEVAKRRVSELRKRLEL